MNAVLTRNDVAVLAKNLDGYRGNAWLVKIEDNHYVVSAVILSEEAMFLDLALKTGMRTTETMAFEATADGMIASWMDLAMVPYRDHWACIDVLLDRLSNPDEWD